MNGSACGGGVSGGGPSLGMSGAQVAALRGAIQGAADRNTIATSAPYYSRVFFASDAVEDAGSFTYTFPQGAERRAFGYAKTDPIPGAPFAVPANQATSADTNIMSKGQTLAGQTVLIQGVSIMVQPGSDFEVARRLLSETSVSISLNGDNQQLEMGTPLNLPGIGGLYGYGFTGLVPPEAQASAGSAYAKLGSNGVPAAESFRRVPEGLIWRPAGKTDGTLVIKLKTERSVIVGPVLERAAQADPLVFAYDPPASVYVDLMVHLICIAISDASVNL